MNPQQIRPLALCIFRKGNRILVFEGRIPGSESVFYRPLGGGIDFGEHSAETAVREIKEELGADICQLVYLATFENIFTVNGQTGHEIIQMYNAEFVDPGFYDQEHPEAYEADGAPIKVVWKELDAFEREGLPLYPVGLLELLTSSTSA